MRIRRILLALIIISVFIWNGSVNALAMNTGFSIEKVEHSEQENFLSNINLRLVTEEPEISSIECFDVNDNELVAVGSKNLSKRIVSIYATVKSEGFADEFDIIINGTPVKLEY